MATFPSIRIEGGLLGPDILDLLLTADLPGQRPADFGLDNRRSLTDEIAAVFTDTKKLWEVFQHRLERLPEDDIATSATRDTWMIPFLGLLGYEPKYNQRGYEIDGSTFALSHRAGEADDTPPVHIVGSRQELGRVAASGRPRLAPHSLVQEYLNRTENLWGLVTNGLTLRLLRDSTFVRRQAYVEFDLQSIIEERHFQEFSALYRLLHRSRLPESIANASDCLLEKYYSYSVEQGGRVRDHLRDGVEECLTHLANGFLRHPDNTKLRRRVSPECTGNERLDAGDIYRQLLRLVYRFLFLIVSEDRGLLSPNPLYREHYGVARLRRLLDSRAAYTKHDDLWQSLRVLWRTLSDERLAAVLQLAPLNGELFAEQALDIFAISNRDLLDAFWYLANYRESAASTRRVNYAALDVEEFGSVYESLLELKPHLTFEGRIPEFMFLQEGHERRSTGSHYTPPELVAPLVQHALEPVLNERLRGAKTREQKQRAILSLKVCDIACGSGHFLLAAARRLGKELACVNTGEDEPAPERVREAIREIVTHCIYGVDKNPLAVELCRVALWMECHAAGKPLTFLDHRIRCGDSLVGVFDLNSLEAGIPDEAFKPVAGDDRTAAREARRRNARERSARLFHQPFTETIRNLADRLHSQDDQPENTIEQVRHKAETYRRVAASPEFEQLRLACDVWTAAFFQPFPSPAGAPVTTEPLHTALATGSLRDPRLSGFVLQNAVEHRFFHWPLAFPEVLAGGGFDVILGNPPFMGGLKISETFGDKYRHWMDNSISGFKGIADLCAAFFTQAYDSLNSKGTFGLLATNTIAQGDTRLAGLAEIIRRNGIILFANRFVKWPGRANVEVNLLCCCKAAVMGSPILDRNVVEFISSRLDTEPEVEPATLNSSLNKAFQGDVVRGGGFVLEPTEARSLLMADEHNQDCIFPYLSGENINEHPKQMPSRFVICFHDWEYERAAEYEQLIDIVRTRVKPERDIVRQSSEREKWWLFGRFRGEMRGAIQGKTRVLARSRVSELHAPAFINNNLIFSDATVVFAFDDYYHFTLLQSNLHEAWVRRNASTMRTDVRYTPTDCFETFPFPQHPDTAARAEAERLGEAYHEHRRQTMLARQLGLTKTYNLFHKPECNDEDVAYLRELHAAMDRAIGACYGWTDLDLGHGFHQNERGQTRFTISPIARRELLRRLLALNLEVATREAAEGGNP